jgi:hypothetical protein
LLLSLPLPLLLLLLLHLFPRRCTYPSHELDLPEQSKAVDKHLKDGMAAASARR